MKNQIECFLVSGLCLLAIFVTSRAQLPYSESGVYKPRTVPHLDLKKKDVRSTAPSTAFPPIPVSIRVSVLDRNFQPVDGLTKDDFKVFVDDQETQISTMYRGGEIVTYILMIDNSVSSTMAIKDLGERVQRTIDALGTGEQVIAIAFSERFKKISESTDDRDKLRKAVRKATANGESGTSLYDHVHRLSTETFRSLGGPVAVILFTDGVDSTSRKVKMQESLAAAETANAAYYVVYLDTLPFLLASNERLKQNLRNFPVPIGLKLQDPRQMQMEYETGKRYLSDLMLLSGGHAVRDPADQSPGILRSSELPAVIRSQYTLTFLPTAAYESGQRRTLRVRVNRSNLNVIARGSIITPAS